MDLRIEKLKEKYWAGETSTEEERELKKYFSENHPVCGEDLYFVTVAKQQKVNGPRAFVHPAKRKTHFVWLAAAVFIILISVGAFLKQYNDRGKIQQFAVKDPVKAYAITKASLMMVSKGLNKGKSYTYELTKLDDAKQIIEK